jgi:hypothetical protein
MLEILPIADVFIVVFTALVVIMISTYISSSRRRTDQLPHVPYLVPYVGSIVGFGTNPVQFIRNNYEKVCAPPYTIVPENGRPLFHTTNLFVNIYSVYANVHNVNIYISK